MGVGGRWTWAYLADLRGLPLPPSQTPSEISKIDSLLATSPPRPVADSLAAERARRVQSREEKLSLASLASLVVAAVAIVPVVVYVVLRDLEE